MKTTKDSVMLVELATNLPTGFPRAIARMIGSAYTEAWLECKDQPRLGAFEKENVFPHLRRGIIETMLRELTKKQGLEHSVEILSLSEGNAYTRVRSGRIVFSVHHVDQYSGPTPRFANYRKQNSVVNLHVEQFMLIKDHIDRDKPIYAYFVHTTNPDNKHQLGEIHITVPGCERMDSICSYEITELIAAQQGDKKIVKTDEDLDIRRKSEEEAE
jgi:hypothetical protein